MMLRSSALDESIDILAWNTTLHKHSVHVLGDDKFDQLVDALQTRFGFRGESLDSLHIKTVGATKVIKSIVRSDKHATAHGNRADRLDSILVEFRELLAIPLSICCHLLAMERLLQGDQGCGYNLGTGAGNTVREVMESVGRVMDAPVPYEAAPRREGDPTELYADNQRIVRELGWDPHYPDLDNITRTAVAWARNPRY